MVSRYLPTSLLTVILICHKFYNLLHTMILTSHVCIGSTRNPGNNDGEGTAGM